MESGVYVKGKVQDNHTLQRKYAMIQKAFKWSPHKYTCHARKELVIPSMTSVSYVLQKKMFGFLSYVLGGWQILNVNDFKQWRNISSQQKSSSLCSPVETWIRFTIMCFVWFHLWPFLLWEKHYYKTVLLYYMKCYRTGFETSSKTESWLQ